MLTVFQRLRVRLERRLPAYPLRAVTRRHHVFSRRLADGYIADIRALQGAGADRFAGWSQRFSEILRRQSCISLGLRGHYRRRKSVAQFTVRAGAREAVLQPDLLLRNDRDIDRFVCAGPCSHRYCGGRWPCRAGCLRTRIVDEAGAPLPSGHEGVVLVRTPVSVTGYLDTSGQSETVFRDGHFDTGDIGYLTQDRMLVITGRKKEVLNLGGDKVSPQLIEDAVAAFRGIREVGAFSMANDVGVEEVWSFIVHGDALDTDALHKHCRERLSQTHVPVRFISVPSLPRNANGKLQRQRLPAMAQELRGAGQ